MSKVRLSAAARQEFVKEVAYYEAIRRGLGSRFRRAATAAFRRLAEFPLHGKPGIGGTRRMLIEGFPFAVVYLSGQTETVVHAVAHLSREPAYWASRLNTNP